MEVRRLLGERREWGGPSKGVGQYWEPPWAFVLVVGSRQ